MWLDLDKWKWYLEKFLKLIYLKVLVFFIEKRSFYFLELFIVFIIAVIEERWSPK